MGKRDLLYWQKIIGKNVRSLRRERGLSQENVAADCGLNRSHMGQIERGETNVTLSSLVKLAEHLETTPYNLLMD